MPDNLILLDCGEIKSKKISFFFGDINKCYIFASPKTNAKVAQLVEHNLAKVRVASSSLVFRSKAKFKVCKSFELLTLKFLSFLPGWWNW